MKIKTSELTGPALDWAVAKCEGRLEYKPGRCFDCRFHEERAVQDGSEHYCHHPIRRVQDWSHWYSDEARFSTSDTTHPRCPYPYPEPYSTGWAQGGPIIERGRLTVGPVSKKDAKEVEEWQAYSGWNWDVCEPLFEGEGLTPLIAAMRCYVASKLGDEVEVPEELK